LVFAATIFATIPLSPQVTSRGLALHVDQAQAITYGHQCHKASPGPRNPS
jgi:hypothetical protein